MSYDFSFAMSVKISDATIKDMIKDIVEKQTGQKVKDINFNYRMEASEYGMNEPPNTVFDGATITFVDSTAKRYNMPEL